MKKLLIFLLLAVSVLLLTGKVSMSSTPSSDLRYISDNIVGLPVVYGYEHSDVGGNWLLWQTSNFKPWALVIDILIDICLPVGILIILCRKKSSSVSSKASLFLIVGITVLVILYLILIHQQILAPLDPFHIDYNRYSSY